MLITTMAGGVIDAAIAAIAALTSVITGAIPTSDAAWLIALIMAKAWSAPCASGLLAASDNASLTSAQLDPHCAKRAGQSDCNNQPAHNNAVRTWMT
jgi:hypothetical protein